MPPVGIEPRTSRLGAICFTTTPPRLNVELVFQAGLDKKKLNDVSKRMSPIPLGRNRVTI